MIYPKFLKEGDTIGIVALSSGINMEDTSFDVSLEHLKEEGYNIEEMPSTRTGETPSASAHTRALEFNKLMSREDIDFIYTAAGGDFLIEVLPYIDDKILQEKIINGQLKWFVGYSDPTTLLYYLTTKYDIATIYGTNAGSFAQRHMHISLKNALSIIKGNIPLQESFGVCQRASYEEIEKSGTNDYILNSYEEWKTPNGNVDIEGRLIGGCIDCLGVLLGTKFDYTHMFIEKYKEDGIVWYFDNFALKSEELYYTLWKMREANCFKYAKGFVFGRTKYEGTSVNLSYEDAVRRALGNELPIIMEADIGHVKPTFSLINGSIAHFVSSNGKGTLEMKLR
ncbi:MAG: LD-carboxypeptidase [Clostridia bacterium]|nr:LD-carboxypeptidase [Clostridia bacterium]